MPVKDIIQYQYEEVIPRLPAAKLQVKHEKSAHAIFNKLRGNHT